MKSLPLLIPLLLGNLYSSCSSYQKQAGLVDSLAGRGQATPSGRDQQDEGGVAAQEQTGRRQYERYGIPPDGAENPVQGQTDRMPNQLEPAADPKPESSKYPVARGTSSPDQVESPYPPHHRINVSGFRSGQLAKDPKNGKIFRIP